MCADAPVHHANHTNDLRRIDRGLYARADRWQATEARYIPPPESPGEVTPTSSFELETLDVGNDWFWEGNVQAAVVAGLARNGWLIRSVSDTTSRSPGTDVVAHKDGQVLHVEVKGYPSDRYARGENQGKRKPTQPATQARVWFAGALLKATMLRNDHPGDLIAIGLPSFGTYRALVERVSDTLSASRIDVLWIEESGEMIRRVPDGDVDQDDRNRS